MSWPLHDAEYERWLHSLCSEGHTLIRCGVGLYRCQDCRYELHLYDGDR